VGSSWSAKAMVTLSWLGNETPNEFGPVEP
jgi:hypothetical protein